LNISLTSSTCAGRACPGTLDNINRHYDAYSFVNTTGQSVCVTVRLTPACLGAAQVQSEAYLGSCNPNNICANYLGDIGPIPTPLPTATSCTVNGAIELTDGVQAGRLITLLAGTTCAPNPTCPGTFDSTPRHYDAYTYTNTSNATVCVTVNLSATCTGLLLQS